MKSAALTYGSGPGSAIALSPTSIRVRDAIIEKFIDKSLEELNSFLATALDSETDDNKRIGILAARVYILRTRISKISEYNENPLMSKVEEVSPYELVNSSEEDEPEMPELSLEGAEKIALDEWNELVTIKDGEVNGVRIPSGVTITVGREDAARLIETGKALRVAEDGSVLEGEPAAADPADEIASAPETEELAEATSSADLQDSTVSEDSAFSPGIMVEDSAMPTSEMPTEEMPTDETVGEIAGSEMKADKIIEGDVTGNPGSADKPAGEGETDETQA